MVLRVTIFRAARGRLPRAMVRLWAVPRSYAKRGRTRRATCLLRRSRTWHVRASGQPGSAATHSQERVARRGRCRLFYSGCNTAHLSLSSHFPPVTAASISPSLPTHPDTPTPLAPPTTPNPVIAPQDPPCPRSERPPDSERGSLVSGESREMPCRLRSG